MSECKWTADEDGVWWTACGQGYVLNEGGPVENRLKYCGWCGQPLVEVPYVEDIDEDIDDKAEDIAMTSTTNAGGES